MNLNIKNVEENKSEYIKNVLSGLNFGKSKEETYLKMSRCNPTPLSGGLYG